MEYPFDNDQKTFREHLSRWVDERLIPRAEELDESGEFARDLFKELGELGYLGIKYPEEYGGAGLDQRYVYYTMLCEELARGSMGFAATVAMHGSAASHMLFEDGTEEQKQKYLVPALKGDMVCAFAITEPQAGSDAAAIRTRAERTNDGWVINGNKIFTSNSVYADFITVVAKVDGVAGAQGMALFLVDTKTPGFSVGRQIEKFTTHCSDTAELFFEDMKLPLDCRLGGEESDFKSAYRMLTVDRVITAAIALGNAKAAYTAALEYAQEREQFGQTIGSFQAVQFKLVDMLATLEQAHLYTYHCAAMADRGEDVTKEAAIAKIVAGDGGNEICQKALNIFGGYGLTMEYPAQRYLRDSFFPVIGGGTSDIMRLIASRKMGL
ncbi:MAG: acyl-CoA dehydrogenase family protein [Rhodospirillales bacterium]|nr:acyl-CoA dehydrogenase family protein [Rhodospirillales bacterium]